MSFGYNNKVLFVDLSSGEMHTEEPGDLLYRMYLGGDGIGTYYAMRDIPAHADPLGPENRLVISTGVCTGAPVCAASRVMANFKSPVTGGIGSSQGGGAFGVRMKYAGFDAVVIYGRAASPVYLYLANGSAEIRSAEHIWGMKNKDYTDVLTSELGASACPFGIGPAGENVLLYSNICTGQIHFCGRTGTGAVMGSKNLKCIVAVGNKPMYGYADPETLKAYDRLAVEKARNGDFNWWRSQGTSGCPVDYNDSGVLPTKNYTEGYFPDADKIETNAWVERGVYAGNHGCLRCGIACKQRMRANKAEHGYDVDPNYGGPEYETAAAFGSNLLINDVVAVGKANELCNAYGIDTISFGAEVSFLMECYEKGLITSDDCYGVEPKWGSAELLLTLLQKSVERAPGLGNAMADGLAATAAYVGQGSEKYAFATKNNPYPLHAPQGRQNMALTYATHEYVDHQTVELDYVAAEGSFDSNAEAYYGRGIYFALPYPALTEEKVKYHYYSHIQFSVTNCLGVCDFGWNSGTAYDINDTIGILKATTGWNTNLWELYKSVERVLCLQRLFNEREGLSSKDDTLPERLFGLPYPDGALKGVSLSKADWLRARELYYDMAGLDEEGHLRRSKVIEMDLQWAHKLVKASE